MIFRINYHNIDKNGDKVYRVYGYANYCKEYLTTVSKKELSKFFIGRRYNSSDGSYTTLKSADSIVKEIKQKCEAENITPKIILNH